MSSVICRVAPSDGAKLLSEALEVRRVSPENVGKSGARTIINWGCSSFSARDNQRVFNLPAAVSVSSDKRRTFEHLRDGGVRIPQFTFGNPASLRTKRGDIILARIAPNASQGKGIAIVRDGQPYPPAPLYVKYIKKLREYRVHVAFGQAILVVEKRARRGYEQSKDDALFRNHGDAWVFCERDLNCDIDGTRDALEEEAVKAIRAVGLHFGAADVVKSRDTGEYFVLETNSKPGIASISTLMAYRNAFQQRLRQS